MSDNQEIVEHKAQSTEIAPASHFAAIMSMVLDAARDPSIDAAKVETMANLAMTMQDREQVQQFRSDKAKAIMEMPVIRRDGKIVIPAKGNEPERVQGRFAKWESLQAAIAPILARHHLVISHRVGGNDNRVMVTPVLTHTNGYEEVGDPMPLPLDTSGGKNNTQAAGSSQSYGMRYSAVAMLNIRIAGIDDDGNQGKHAGGEDNLTPAQRQLVDAGRSAAMQGSAAYQEWFGSQSAAAKGWLAFGEFHEQNKQAATLADK